MSTQFGKFSEITYTRPNIHQLKKDMVKLLTQFINAKDFASADKLFFERNELYAKLMTTYTVAHIRHDINTADKYYEQEVTYLLNHLALLLPLQRKANKAMLKTPYKRQFIEKYGDMMFKDAETFEKTSSWKNIPLSIRMNKLTMQYSKLVAMAKVDFNGEQCNFYGLLKHMQDTDRQIRKSAYEAFAGLYAKLAPELDEIYTKLIKLRIRSAKNAKFSNYIDFMYLTRGRYDYTQSDVAKFRNQILDTVTPLCCELIEQQRQRIGVDKMHIYDESILFADGNADPIGDKDYLLQKTLEMYQQLSQETKEFFEFMTDHQLFDLETKPNKHMGGYCITMLEYQAPFIFSNFNGTAADVQVLTHEAGHCFNMYLSMRQNVLPNISSTAEVNEIHSKSMEMFTYPYWQVFFGGKTDKARYAHLVDTLCTLPYMCTVDEFQHEIYSHPRMNADQRRATWRALEKKYMPWRDWDGNAYMESGGFWMQKQHIFLYPFYYIDYALAQMGAYEFYGRSKIEPTKAWDDYVNLCRAGGSKSYLELLELANISSPFADCTVERAINYIKPELDKAP
ncbi:MAG: M3 family oligoendopeptidase [Clostridia bacterium]|nr:M3 family oligoendopeptidase [Clostridia bacterium]